MDNLNSILQQLISEACTYPPGSLERRYKLSAIYRAVMNSGKLWKERMPYYNDALQEMWEHCCQHIEHYQPPLTDLRQSFLEADRYPLGSLENQQKIEETCKKVIRSGWNWKDKTLIENDAFVSPGSQNMPELQRILTGLDKRQNRQNSVRESEKAMTPDRRAILWLGAITWLSDRYSPSLKNVMTWLNDDLKRRLRRWRDAKGRAQKRQLFPQQIDENRTLDPIDTLPARPDAGIALDIWDSILDWLRRDPEQILRDRCFPKQADIYCQTLLLLRLESELSWEEIAARFTLTVAETQNLPKWCSRYCFPRLRHYVISQGYIEERPIRRQRRAP